MERKNLPNVCAVVRKTETIDANLWGETPGSYDRLPDSHEFAPPQLDRNQVPIWDLCHIAVLLC